MGDYLRGQSGSSMVGTVIFVALLGMIGAAVTEISSSDSAAGTNEVQGIHAVQIGNAGIEYALDKIDAGESPDVKNKSFSNGSFTIVTDPPQQTLAVTSVSGNARKVQSITTDFAEQVMELSASSAIANGNVLQNLELTKAGNSATILTSLTIKWDYSLCAQNVDCPEDSDEESSDKVTICHYPSGDPSKAHTMTVGSSAVDAHVKNHGDTLGACGTETETVTTVDCEGLDEEVSSCSKSDGATTVTSVKINGVTVASGIAAASGETIDISDQKFTADQTYLVDEIAFSSALPEGAWYSLTLHFADGSSETQSFKLASSGSKEDEDDSDQDEDEDDKDKDKKDK